MQHEECPDPQASAQAFADKLLDTGVNLDFSLRSLHVDIDPLLGSSLYCDRDSPSRWRGEASLAAYVGETLRRLFDGQWEGSFNASNPGPNFYRSWVQFGEFRYFPSHFLSYRLKNSMAETGSFGQHLERVLPVIGRRKAVAATGAVEATAGEPPADSRPLVLPANCIQGVDKRGVQFLDANNAQRFVSFAECRANATSTLARSTAAGAALVGFRDASANPAWIEFTSSPAIRFVFEPRETPRTSPGARFMARRYPPGYLELLETLGEFDLALGDLG